MVGSAALLILVSFLFGTLWVWGLRLAFSKTQFLTVRGIPLTGGLGMALAFFATLFVSFTADFTLWASPQLWSVVWASLILIAAGIVDDVKELSVTQKFLVQTVAAFILILSGVRTEIGSIGVAANVLLSFLWIIGITNAMNLLDVMDGLAATISIPILLCFSAISLLNQDGITLLLASALTGAVAGFLIYNFPPAKIYMGNSGSHFLGLLLSAMALTARYATPETRMALLAPFLILGFPIFDTAFLVLMRIKKGRSAFGKSDDHLGLRYLRQGHSKRMTLLLMLGISIFFVVCGFLMSGVSNQEALIVLIVAVLFSLLVANRMNGVDG